LPKGLITSLLLKLTIDYWYLTLAALIIKLILIHYTVGGSGIKVFLIWITGNITFYTMACLAGIVFTTVGFYYIPFIMYVIASAGEILFCSVFFRLSYKKLMLPVLLGDALFFSLLFVNML
jgi:hypothetical protein